MLRSRLSVHTPYRRCALEFDAHPLVSEGSGHKRPILTMKQPVRLSSSWLLFVTVMASVIVLTACESDADRIRSTSGADPTEAASSAPSPTATPLSAEIEAADIQDGDCIDSSIQQVVTIESVVIVPCSGS